MELSKPVYVCAFLLSLLAAYIGIGDKQADIIMPGILSAVLSAIMLLMSFKGKSMNIKVPLILALFLIVSMVANSFDFTDFVRIAFATPLFVALGACIVVCLVAYTKVRLDRAMFYVYLLFMTLAVSNTFSYGIYYYYMRYGVADEMQANFWLVDEFAFALTFCILSMFIIRTYLRKKDIRLIQAGELLEGYNGSTE